MDRAALKGRLKRGVVHLFTHHTWVFVIVISVSLLTSLFTINYLSIVDNELKLFYDKEILGQDYIQNAYGQLLQIENAVQAIIIFNDPETTNASLATVRQSTSELKKAIGNATPRFYTPAGREILAQSKKDLNSFIAFLEPITAQLSVNSSLDRAVLVQLKAKKDRVQADFKHLIANKTANSSNGFEDITAQLRWSLILSLAIVGGSVVLRVSMYLVQRRQLRRS